MRVKKYALLFLCLILTLMPMISLAEGEQETTQEPVEVAEQSTENSNEAVQETPVVEETQEVEKETSNEQVNKETEAEEKQKQEDKKAEEQKKLEEQQKAEEAQKKAEEEKAKAEADKKAKEEEEAKKKAEEEKIQPPVIEPNYNANNGSTAAYVGETKTFDPEIGTMLRYPLPRRGAITTYFGAVDSLHPTGHTGLDLAIAQGTPILACESGKIVYASWWGGGGNTVKIEHSNGMATIYCHMSQISVAVGESVVRGQQIGLVGSTGHSTGPHLHLEVYPNGLDGTAVNPLPYLEKDARDETTEYANVKFLFVDKENTSSIVDKLISFLKQEVETSNPTEKVKYLGEEVVEYGKQFASIGNDASANYKITTPYILGGYDLTKGVDCGGFVKAVYEHFGYDIKFGSVGVIYDELMKQPYVEIISSNLGTQENQEEIEKWLPGDIIFFSDSEYTWSHVAIYAGEGQIVHSKWERSGVILENLYSNGNVYSGKSITNVVRIIDPIETKEETSEVQTEPIEYNNILFQLNERLPVEIADGKTTIDISDYYNNGLIVEEPILILSKEGREVEFVTEEVPENKELTKQTTVGTYKLVINEEVKQSEMQLIIPSKKIAKSKVLTYINSDFPTIESDIMEFSPLFDIRLNLGIKDITVENIKIKVDGKTLPYGYYEYVNEELVIHYSCLNISELTVDITKEKQKLPEDLMIKSNLNGITTWIETSEFNPIKLNSSMENCYVVSSLINNEIESEFNVLPYTRYNFNKDGGEIVSQLLIDNQLADGFVSIPVEQFKSEMKIASETDPESYNGDTQPSEELTIEDKNHNIFIYGEKLNVLDTSQFEDGYKTVDFEILDYTTIEEDTFFIVKYQTEGIGGYFGIQVSQEQD